MTLVEVMIATSIGTLILAAAGSLMVYNARSLAALSNYADLERLQPGRGGQSIAGHPSGHEHALLHVYGVGVQFRARP